MIDIKLLEKREVDPATGLSFIETYKNNLRHRRDDPAQVDRLMALSGERKRLLSEFEQTRAKQKKLGQEMAQRSRKGEDTSAIMEETQQLSRQVKKQEDEVAAINSQVEDLLLRLPNWCDPAVPVGESSEDNQLVRRWGEPREFGFPVQDHVTLGQRLDIIDFERASKVTGSRFAFMKGLGARLERALIQFMMDLHTTEHGYREMIPPFIVNSESLRGTGNFPKFREDVFNLRETDYFLIPTAEIPVTNYYRGEVLDEADLPQSFVAYSPCFRSEAGSHGRDTRGLIRQHQFNKVELMKFVHPSVSEEEHEKLTNHAERVLQLLELPYRVMSLCTADISFGAARCYDIEVWLPGQNGYREISSCSNFKDFQARRADIRFRSSADGKLHFVHTLNGSGLAVGRTVIALLENRQQEDGSVTLPRALRPYMGGSDKIG